MESPRSKRVRSIEEIASTVTAYVYGNIIVLTTLVPLSRHNAEDGTSFWIVLGVSAATFLAHAFAESIGLRVRVDHRLTREEALSELRSSLPILVSGVVPAVMLGIAWLTDIPGLWAQLVAEGYVIVRLGLLGVRVAGMRGQKSSWRVTLSGIGVAVVGAAIAAAKVVLGH